MGCTINVLISQKKYGPCSCLQIDSIRFGQNVLCCQNMVHLRISPLFSLYLEFFSISQSLLKKNIINQEKAISHSKSIRLRKSSPPPEAQEQRMPNFIQIELQQIVPNMKVSEQSYKFNQYKNRKRLMTFCSYRWDLSNKAITKQPNLHEDYFFGVAKWATISQAKYAGSLREY